MSMKKAELEATLETKKVPKQMYSLDGVKDGECYCVARDGDAWKVIYMERGRSSDIAAGLSEEDAYDTLYHEFRAMYGWA
jgi:hypothetical protein